MTCLAATQVFQMFHFQKNVCVGDMRAYIKVDKRLFSLQNVLFFVYGERKVFPFPCKNEDTKIWQHNMSTTQRNTSEKVW